MKKIRLIVISVLCLVTTLVVSSFAWFQLKNNGILSQDVNTKREISIYFTQDGVNDGFMSPATLKKGVINDKGNIYGDSILVPSGEKVLPSYDEETWEYNFNNGEFVTQSEYLEEPATVVYSQFEMSFTTNIEDDIEDEDSKKIYMEFSVKYFNVDVDDSNKSNATTFKQRNALTFNFFVLERALTDDELKIISTHIGGAATSKKIEKFIVDNQIPLKNDTGTSDNTLTYAGVDNYRYKTTLNKNVTEYPLYQVVFSGLEVNKPYYILLESYYSIPDQLVEGNLPLTGKFLLDLSYTINLNETTQ